MVALGAQHKDDGAKNPEFRSWIASLPSNQKKERLQALVSRAVLGTTSAKAALHKLDSRTYVKISRLNFERSMVDYARCASNPVAANPPKHKSLVRRKPCPKSKRPANWDFAEEPAAKQPTIDVETIIETAPPEVADVINIASPSDAESERQGDVECVEGSDSPLATEIPLASGTVEVAQSSPNITASPIPPHAERATALSPPPTEKAESPRAPSTKKAGPLTPSSEGVAEPRCPPSLPVPLVEKQTPLSQPAKKLVSLTPPAEEITPHQTPPSVKVGNRSSSLPTPPLDTRSTVGSVPCPAKLLPDPQVTLSQRIIDEALKDVARSICDAEVELKSLNDKLLAYERLPPSHKNSRVVQALVESSTLLGMKSATVKSAVDRGVVSVLGRSFYPNLLSEIKRFSDFKLYSTLRLMTMVNMLLQISQPSSDPGRVLDKFVAQIIHEQYPTVKPVREIQSKQRTPASSETRMLPAQEVSNVNTGALITRTHVPPAVITPAQQPQVLSSQQVVQTTQAQWATGRYALTRHQPTAAVSGVYQTAAHVSTESVTQQAVIQGFQSQHQTQMYVVAQSMQPRSAPQQVQAVQHTPRQVVHVAVQQQTHQVPMQRAQAAQMPLQMMTQMAQQIPQQMAQHMQQMHQQAPQQIVQQRPQQMQQMVQQMPQQMPQQIVQQIPQQMPQQIVQQIPQQMPQQIVQQIPQKMLQQMPQHRPQQMPQQVAGGQSQMHYYPMTNHLSQQMVQVQTMQPQLSQYQPSLSYPSGHIQQAIGNQGPGLGGFPVQQGHNFQVISQVSPAARTTSRDSGIATPEPQGEDAYRAAWPRRS